MLELAGLIRKMQSSLDLSNAQLACRHLSSNESGELTSSVLVVRSNGWDKGYVWVDLDADKICCHSNAMSRGPMSSAERKFFVSSDPALESNLTSTITALIDA